MYFYRKLDILWQKLKNWRLFPMDFYETVSKTLGKLFYVYFELEQYVPVSFFKVILYLHIRQWILRKKRMQEISLSPNHHQIPNQSTKYTETYKKLKTKHKCPKRPDVLYCTIVLNLLYWCINKNNHYEYFIAEQLFTELIEIAIRRMLFQSFSLHYIWGLISY